MNEELKIIITAAVQEAVGEMQKVNKELQKIEKNSNESKKSFDESMKTLAKGAAVAVTSITAITTAMVALGNKSAAAQKEVGKLQTAFQSMGSSAKQANETYVSLYRFMGDSGAATEAAAHLAKITTNSQDLAQWAQILQGVYSNFGASLPIESLTEAANESLRVGVVTGALADALNWAGASEDEFNAQLAQTTSLQQRERLLRTTLNNLYTKSSKLYERNNAALLANAEAQARLDAALADAHRYLVPLLTSLTQLATTLLVEFKPVLEVVSATLVAFVQYLVAAVKWVGAFFYLFDDGGSSAIDTSQTIGDAMSSINSSTQGAVGGVGNLSGALGDAADAAKELKKQTMGFDELNILQSNSAGGSSGSGSSLIPSIGSGISMPDVSGVYAATGLTDFQKKVEKVKEAIESLVVLAGIFAATLAGIYFFEYWYTEIMAVAGGVKKLSKALTTMGGKLLIIAGLALTIKNWIDAWQNGVDWGNLIGLIGGLALAVTGVYMAFGKWYAMVAMVAAGISLMVLGVKDFIKNGPTMENTILIIGGAVAVAVGLATAGLSVLISAIVAAVAAIGAFIAAILLEEPAIMTVEEAQRNLTDAINATIEAENNYINALDAAESARKRLEEAEKAAGVTGEELRRQVEEGTLTYAEMTDAQRECYKAYLDNEKKQKDLEESTKAFEAAKKAEIIASYENQLALAKESGNYEDFKKSVVDAFNSGRISADEARELISKSMSEMSDDSQKTFMQDLPNDIKNGLDPHKYESTGTKIKKWFSNLWTGIKNLFSDAGKWFSQVGKLVGEALGGAFKKVVNWILEQIEKTINAPFKMINNCIDILNKIPGVEISKLKLIEIPRLAKGGIATSSTLANIGEAGKEAVLPLENNTEWMNILADKINQRSNTPSKIVLMVDGKELGWASINGINDITKQTGTLQLQLA